MATDGNFADSKNLKILGSKAGYIAENADYGFINESPGQHFLPTVTGMPSHDAMMST